VFSEQFSFQTPATISFVGGGGKTGLILTLLNEISRLMPVIYTTTTRIHPPDLSAGLLSLSGDNPGLLKLMLETVARDFFPQFRKLVVTGLSLTGGRNLKGGVPPGFARTLNPELFPMILNEADGAASMSLKMPRDGEPVLMEGSNYLVPVIGLDCLLKPLGPETLFRWNMARTRFSLKEGEIISPELAAHLLMHPEGVCKHWRQGIRIIPFINKSDDPNLDSLAKDLAVMLLHNNCFPVERVVWGSLLKGRAASLTPNLP
jgi:probable selenium-dependent hydroxylase accessory protein YqeC